MFFLAVVSGPHGALGKVADTRDGCQHRTPFPLLSTHFPFVPSSVARACGGGGPPCRSLAARLGPLEVCEWRHLSHSPYHHLYLSVIWKFLYFYT